MTCNVIHPEDAGVACLLNTTTHSRHLAVVYVDHQAKHVSWPNDEYVSRAEQREQSSKAKTKVSQLAQEAREALPEPSVDPNRKPLRQKSAQGRVASFLLEHVGEWIPGRRFIDPMAADGGAAALRRVRSLRTEHGWEVEDRPDPDPNTFVHQYRLTSRPHDVEII